MAIFRNLGVNQPEADKPSRGGQVGACPVECLPAHARPASPICGWALEWQAGEAYSSGVNQSRLGREFS